jgi:hypothetical protein
MKKKIMQKRENRRAEPVLFTERETLGPTASGQVACHSASVHRS